MCSYTFVSVLTWWVIRKFRAPLKLYTKTKLKLNIKLNPDGVKNVYKKIQGNSCNTFWDSSEKNKNVNFVLSLLEKYWLLLTLVIFWCRLHFEDQWMVLLNFIAAHPIVLKYIYSKYFSLEQSLEQTTCLAKKNNNLKKNCLVLGVELAHLYQRQNPASQYSQASSNILFHQFQSPCEQRLQLTVC